MSWIQAPASQGGSFVSQGRAALPLLVIVAATVVVLSFMLGRQIGSEACALKSDGAAHLLPGTKIAPWRPPSGECRHDYISVIAEGAEGKSPPQLSLAQMLWIANAVRTARPKGEPSDFLVFGLGYDSAIWASANCGGTTVFLENLKPWIDEVTAKIPGITVHEVTYTSKLDDPAAFFKAPSEPQLPPEMEGACFDVVLVDSPMGWKKGAGQPGRFQPVYYAINMARRCIKAGKKQQVTIFVHDAEREVEGLLIKAYLTADDTRHLGQLTGPFGKLVGVLVTPAMTKDALLGDKDSRNTGDKKDGSGTSDMKESSSTSDKGV